MTGSSLLFRTVTFTENLPKTITLIKHTIMDKYSFVVKQFTDLNALLHIKLVVYTYKKYREIS